MGLGGQELDHEGEAHIVARPHMVEECLIGGDDDGEAQQRIAGYRTGVGAVRDRELALAGRAVDKLPGVSGNSAAEVSDPVGEPPGRFAGVAGQAETVGD